MGASTLRKIPIQRRYHSHIGGRLKSRIVTILCLRRQNYFHRRLQCKRSRKYFYTKVRLVSLYLWQTFTSQLDSARIFEAKKEFMVSGGHFSSGTLSDRSRTALGTLSSRSRTLTDRSRNSLGPLSDRSRNSLGPLSDRSQTALGTLSGRSRTSHGSLKICSLS